MASLRLFASPPGTGKTTRCIELFKERVLKTRGGIDSRCYFVLPSREHAERIQNMILRKDAPGLFNAHILTIQDLADALLRVDKGRPTDTLRRSILSETLEAKNDRGESVYGYFRPSLRLKGFQELLLESIREFKSSLLSVSDFEKRAQPLVRDPIFLSKFRDFSIVLKRYDARLESLGLVEGDDSLGQLHSLPEEELGPELVIFDGFYHFTRAQTKLLSLVSAWSKNTVVTLTVDPGSQAGAVLFEYPERTRQTLLKLGFKEEDGFKDNHRALDPGLRHLAKHVFAPNPPRFKNKAPITVMTAPFPRSEYEMIAREIRRLYREKSFHFSDICLVMRSVSGQKSLIESIFGEYGVPVEIHERNRFSESGLATAVYRLLRLATDGWHRDDVLHLAKSSYLKLRLPLSDALALERIAFREGVAEGRANWLTLAEVEGVTGAARLFLSWLMEIESKLLAAPSVHAFGAEASKFMAVLAHDVPEIDLAARRAITSILLAGRKRYLESGETFDAIGYAREILSAIENGLFSLKIRGRNRVQVYDVIMALPKEYKVVFVCNLVEKAFPQPVTEDPLFKDIERRVINGSDPVIEERGWRLSGERYFFYMAVARAKEMLYLTHAAHDAEGSAALESFFIGETLACFSKDAVTRVERGLSRFLPSSEEWESEADVARGLSSRLLKGGAVSLSEGRIAQTLVRAREYAGAKGFGLKEARVLEALASPGGVFSSSSLEAFLKCPFRYFAESTLRLNGPLEGREYAEMGTLLHETLQEYFVHLSEKDRMSGAYLRDPGQMESALEAIFLRRFEEGPFRGQPLYRRMAWRESMKRMLKKYVQLEEGASGETRPAYFEYEFGREKSNYLRLPDESGEILLRGSIDRVDVDSSGKKAVVIDYKRSSRNLKKKLKEGEEIQLPLYLLAVRYLLTLEPAGLEHRVLKTGKRENPLLSEEDLEKLLSDTQERVRTAVRRIRSGEIAVAPKDCAFCEFDAVCRIESKRGREY